MKALPFLRIIRSCLPTLFVVLAILVIAYIVRQNFSTLNTVFGIVSEVGFIFLSGLVLDIYVGVKIEELSRKCNVGSHTSGA
jgi:hypothetical protein